MADTSNKPQIAVRAANPTDIPSISSIHTHYVLNTVITFKTTPLSPDEHLSNLSKLQDLRLPYLVATIPSFGVVGYTYVSGFRSGKGGYIHTVELSLFVHADHLYKGIGTVLLKTLIDVLKTPGEHVEFVSGVRDKDQRVRHVIACMSVNTDSREEGLGLRKWYENFGFVHVGHLKEVGHKFDRWLVVLQLPLEYNRFWLTLESCRIDTMYLQLTLW